MAQRVAATDGPRVAYVMSRFPKLTETFVLNEILAVEAAGATVDVYPLLREQASVLQPGAAELVARARYQPFLSAGILASQAWWLVRHPRRYLGALATIVRDGWGSPWFILGGLAIVPKVAHATRRMIADGVTHVHCHFASHPATAGLVIHRLSSLPFSFTAHGSDIHRDRHMLCRKVGEAAFVVAVSRSNADVIAGECGPGARARMHVIRCGVDLDRFRPHGRAPGPASEPAEAAGALEGGADGRAGDAPLSVIAIGTLHEVKGQTHLLEACRQLVAAGVTYAASSSATGRTAMRSSPRSGPPASTSRSASRACCPTTGSRSGFARRMCSSPPASRPATAGGKACRWSSWRPWHRASRWWPVTCPASRSWWRTG